MKKLMIAAAVAFVAVASQAATVNWSATNIQKDQKAVSGLLYFVCADNLSRDSVLSLARKGAKAFTDALGAESAHAFKWSIDNGNGSIANNDANRPTNEQLGISDGGTYDFYAVCFNTDTITDDSYFFVTAAKTGQKVSSGTGNKTVGIGNLQTASNATGAWQAVGDVPEPTSAMLLLLGMAGLALKRKHA